MAAKNKIAAQKKNPKKYNKKANTIEIKNHKIIEAITPPIPSPTAGGSNPETSGKEIFSEYFLTFSLCKICPTLSLSFHPKYSPELIKIKKTPAKMDVDTIEF
ncbi:hypothetical protein [Chryseobacterium turcicum]|uniref:Uncharacterized protein n=1 Tax=Chryseobacterium turcicum TaxID=2898076 RepID=A0A9Q3V2Y7_9FLAO|nr:hypothetical protein [Chryseobacterium turcicum]MCD1117167.1 hypothetical protein [Chryseobacterium turcicum]